MKFRCVQTFSLEYLQRCRAMTPYEILQFLDDFHQLHADSLNLAYKKSQTDLISRSALQFDNKKKSSFSK